MRVLVLFCAVFIVASNANLVNEEVSRNIDLKTHLVKVTTSVTLRNDGTAPLPAFQFVVDPSHAKQLAHIQVTEEGEEEGLKLKEINVEKRIFVVTLPKKLQPKDTIKVVVEEIYPNSVNPFPKEISQSQSQLVVYRGNHFYYSPYPTESQTTQVDLSSNSVESYSKFGNPEKGDSTITYSGEDFKNVAPNSQNNMKVHFENNNPFLTISKLERVIEVSHWGNIAVEETVDIRHTGAKLKGSFSRYDYQRQPNSGASSVKSFKSILPASAADVYYRDEIGNISTSNLYVSDESVDFEIKPRFPLFGGWKTHYYIGYNLPSYNYLYARGDVNALKMRFVDHIMDDQVIDDLTVKIILPEGAKNIKVDLPFPVERDEDSLHFTYLDTVGRPVIVLHKHHLVEQHIEDFVVSYTFNKLLLLQEPLLIVGSFFLLFFTVIIVVRLDFSIAHDHISEARMRVQSVIEQVQAHQAKRDSCYKAYEVAVTKFKASKDQNGFATTRKSVEKDHKEATNSIVQLIAKLKEDAIEVGDKKSALVVPEGKSKNKKKRLIIRKPLNLRDKVLQLNQLDSSLKEKLAQSIQQAEKLVGRKISREQYLELDGKIQKSVVDLKDKLMEMADNL